MRVTSVPRRRTRISLRWPRLRTPIWRGSASTATPPRGAAGCRGSWRSASGSSRRPCIRPRASTSPSAARPRSRWRARSQVAAAAAGRPGALPVLVATGYVIARHSSDVGVKMGGRIASLRFEEGTRVRRGEVMAVIEHADLDAQLEAARRAVGEAQAQLAQMTAARDEDQRNLERQRALMKDGITTTAALHRRRIGGRRVGGARDVGRGRDRQREGARRRDRGGHRERQRARALRRRRHQQARGGGGDRLALRRAGTGDARGRRHRDDRRSERARSADRGEREQRREAPARHARRGEAAGVSGRAVSRPAARDLPVGRPVEVDRRGARQHPEPRRAREAGDDGERHVRGAAAGPEATTRRQTPPRRPPCSCRSAPIAERGGRPSCGS